MKINWRKINNILHRDVGYFFFGMSIIYALSGIALNHIADWDPNYDIQNKTIQVDPVSLAPSMTLGEIEILLNEIDIDKKIKKHYYPNSSTLKVFLHGGSLTINTQSGKGTLETVDRRSIFYEVNSTLSLLEVFIIRVVSVNIIFSLPVPDDHLVNFFFYFHSLIFE